MAIVHEKPNLSGVPDEVLEAEGKELQAKLGTLNAQLLPLEWRSYDITDELADRAGEASAFGRDLAYHLGVFLHILEDLPASLKANLPNVGWMTELMHAAGEERRFDQVLIYFDNLSVNLRRNQPEETAWDKLQQQWNAPRQAGGPKSCDLPCKNVGTYNCTHCCVPTCDNGKDGHVCGSAGTSTCPKEVYGH